MIVADAGVILEAIVFSGGVGPSARRRLARDDIHVPEVVDLEILSALRRLVRRGEISQTRAERGLTYLRSANLTRHSHKQYLPRIWELRDSVTPYDAAYVALAERAGAPLLTVDRRLAEAHGPRCQIEVLEM